jgi:photosystem II stability/assembly factor-like uncharacterized protein
MRVSVYFSCLVLCCCLLGLASVGPADDGPAVECEWSRLAIDGGGQVWGLAQDPSNPDTMYCLSDKGGVHRSDDGGQTWTLCTRGFDRETYYSCTGILVDGRNPGRVYVATGEGGWARNFTPAGGIWRSDDRGDHWRLLTTEVFFAGEGDGKMNGNVLEFDPADHNTIYAASFSKGLWVTRDAGATWSQMAFDGSYLSGVWVDPEDRQRLLASVREKEFPGDKPRPRGLFESRNGGKTWARILEVNAVRDVSRHPRHPDWLAAAVNGNEAYVSRDRGKTWTRLTLHPKCKNVRKVRWHVGMGNRLWTVGGDRGVFYTDDFGETWTWPTESIEKSFRYPKDWYMSARKTDWTAMPEAADLLIDPTRPQRMFASDCFTVLASEDGGETWSQKSKGINVVCVYQVACDPKDPQTIYVNNADIGLLKSIDGGKHFFWPIREGEFAINETYQLWIAPADSKHLILTVTYDWKNPHWTRVGVSRDGGETWESLGKGLPLDWDGYLTGLAVLDAQGNEILVAHSGSDKLPGGVYWSRDGGATWQNHSEGLPTAEGPLFGSGWGALPNLAAAGDLVFAATEKGLFACQTKGSTWLAMGKKDLPSGERSLLTLAVDAKRPDCVWVGAVQGLYISRDRGLSFSRVGPKEMQRCQGVAIDPFNPKRWYVAVNQPWWGSLENAPGVYVTEDDGATWSRLSDMPCHGIAWRVTADPHREGVIYVGTNGCGAWRGQIAPPKPAAIRK